MGHWTTHSNDAFKDLDSFKNETPVFKSYKTHCFVSKMKSIYTHY